LYSFGAQDVHRSHAWRPARGHRCRERRDRGPNPDRSEPL